MHKFTNGEEGVSIWSFRFKDKSLKIQRKRREILPLSLSTATIHYCYQNHLLVMQVHFAWAGERGLLVSA